MGRKSREKRERREQGTGPIAKVARGVDQASLVALLEAASVSPTACHRLPSVALAFDAAVKRTRLGQRTAEPGLLPHLVDAAHQEDHSLGTQEDFVPYDASMRVVVRWRDGLYRLFPGSLERPVATIDYLELLAVAIDPILIEQYGYGLADVVELVLRRIDYVTEALGPSWPSDARADVGDVARISEQELEIARALHWIDEEVSRCEHPGRGRLALDRHSVRPKQLRHSEFDPVSTFGSTVAVRAGTDSHIALPAGVLVEALDGIATSLAEEATKLDARAESHWGALVANRIGHMLEGSGHPVVGPVRTPGGAATHSITTYSRRQVLVLDVVPALDKDRLVREMASSVENLDALRVGTEIETPVGRLRLAEDAEVAKLQVVAAPKTGIALPGGQHPIASLDDILWFARTSAREPTDLWHFVRELDDPQGVGSTFAWDLIDAWEVWRHNGKTFYKGGVPITTMMFSPHAAEAEWLAAADAVDVEFALHRLQLPPLNAWPMVDIGDDAVYVADRALNRVFRIAPWSIPVAIATTDPEESGDADTLWGLADGIAWKLTYSRDAFFAAARSSDLDALQVVFVHVEDASGAVLQLVDYESGILTIGRSDTLQEALLEDSPALEASVGQLLSDALFEGVDADAFVTAWNAAPPGVRVDGVSTPQRASELPDPIDVHPALRSAMQRRLGEHLLAQVVPSGSYQDERATRLETDIVYPWLLEELHGVLDRFDRDSLLELGLRQLECANRKRWWYDHKIAWQTGFPVHSRPEDDPPEERREAITARVRSISLIIEELLARPPTGDEDPDPSSWGEALSVAELCVESGFRSETIHLSLSRTWVTVSDNHEVGIEWSDGPTDADLAQYSRVRASGTLPEPVPIGASEAHDPVAEQPDEEPTPFVDLMPDLGGIDSALRESLGFGLNALIGVLNVARQWEVSTAKPVNLSAVEAFLDTTVELAVGATREEYEAAINWLTLGPEDLRAEPLEHWETERRAVRLATRPFVEAADGVWVLPWSSEMTLKILANYLSDGRLPWPARVLPGSVNDALNRYRQTRNRALEVDVVEALSVDPVLTKGSIKPQKASKYGIASLSGEVDALCIDPSQSRIWVVEAKDPFTPFSPRQVRQKIDGFHAEGGYVDKLLRKASEIGDSSAAIAAALGVDNPTRRWEVVALMVTRHPDPAAYAVDARVPFCTLGEVNRVVLGDAAPGSGAVDLAVVGAA